MWETTRKLNFFDVRNIYMKKSTQVKRVWKEEASSHALNAFSHKQKILSIGFYFKHSKIIQHSIDIARLSVFKIEFTEVTQIRCFDISRYFIESFWLDFLKYAYKWRKHVDWKFNHNDDEMKCTNWMTLNSKLI